MAKHGKKYLEAAKLVEPDRRYEIAEAAELARCERVPLVLVTASGGARMQEGALALMQMAKVVQALTELDEAGVLEIVDLPSGQLEVVRLGAGRSEIVDPDIVAADLPDRLGERIEGGHDLNAPARSVRIIVPAARSQTDERAEGECEPTRLEIGLAPHNENDSY